MGQFAERPLPPSGVAATGHGPGRGRTRPIVERRQGPPWTNFAGPEGRARPQDFAGPETPRPGADGGASEAKTVSPVGDPRPGRNGERPRAKKGAAPRPPEAAFVGAGLRTRPASFGGKKAERSSAKSERHVAAGPRADLSRVRAPISARRNALSDWGYTTG